MYNKEQIKSEFRGLIGIRPTYDTGNADAKIDSDLLESSSGVFINDLHGLFSIENLMNIADQFPLFTLSDWSDTRNYLKGEVIEYDYRIFEAKHNNTNSQPDVNPDDWKETTLLSIFIRNTYDNCVLDVIQKVIEAKKAGGYGRQLQSVATLLSREGVKSNTIDKKDRFVGFKLNITQADLAVTIQRIGLQFTGSFHLPLYVYHSSKLEPIYTGNFSTLSNKYTYSDFPDTTLFGTEGFFMIGYYEDDLPAEVKAIYTITEVFSQGGCGSCNHSDRTQRGSWNKYINVVPVSVANYGTKGQMDFTVEEMNIVDYNFGLNFAFSFRCDLSDLFIRQKESFIEALKARLTVKLLDLIGSTSRNNQQADQSSILAYNNLRDWNDPENPKIAFRQAIKNLDFEFSGLNPICLKCNDKVKVKYQVT